MSDKDLEELCCVLNLMSQTAVARLNETEPVAFDSQGRPRLLHRLALLLPLAASSVAFKGHLAFLQGRMPRAPPGPAGSSSTTSWRTLCDVRDATPSARRSRSSVGPSPASWPRIRKRVPYQHDVIFLCVIPHRPQIFLRVDRNEASVVGRTEIGAARGVTPGFSEIMWASCASHLTMKSTPEPAGIVRSASNTSCAISRSCLTAQTTEVKPRRSCAAKKSNGKVLATVNIPVMPKPKASSSSTQELTLVVAVNVVKKSHNESGTLKDGKK
ncbi:hypothetical protein MRX96_024474 [Rhipicephalus microplus]